MRYRLLVLRLKFYMLVNKHYLPRDTVTDYMVLKQIVREWGDEKQTS